MKGPTYYGSLPMPRGRPISNRLELTPEQFASLNQIAGSRSEELRKI